MSTPGYKSVLITIAMGLIVPFFCAAASAEDSKSERRLELYRAAMNSIPKSDAEGKRNSSPYFFVQSDDSKSDRMPLKETRIDVSIAGVIAKVKVTQVYENEGKGTLEAIYIFPASTRAAVHGMRMRVGERLIEAEIKEKAEAKKQYEDAKSAGKTASLLEQRRPNVFQMSVANILPGDVIQVELDYSELLVPEDNMYEFVYPTVVGPRYSNRDAEEAMPEDSWVENPYLEEGQAGSADFDLELNLRSGIPIARVGSPSHDIHVEYADQKVACVELKGGAEAANRDFVLRYSLAGKQIETGLLLYTGEEENFFLLMMQPPERVSDTEILPREYVFIVDISGSMHGFPLQTSKALVRDLLRGLRSYDYFNVLLFAGGSSYLAENSIPATRKNVSRAIDWIEIQRGGGGTQLLPALERVMRSKRQKGTSRIVVVATDGYVNVEKEAFELIRKNLGQTNVFPFGIGSSVNRFIIEGMARAGMGEPIVVLDAMKAARAAERFQKYIRAPLMRDIEIDFGDLDVYDVEPVALHDMFAARPVVVFGKYRGEPKGRIQVTGQLSNGPLAGTIEVDPGSPSEENSALRTLWARQRVAQLADLNVLHKNDERVAEVTKLGLEYSLLTDYTSFVAVDTIVRADGSKSSTVRQPLPLPKGVSNLAVGNSGLLGVLGTTGRGGGSSGIGYGRGSGVFGGSGVAKLSAKSAMVMGSVSTSSVRSVIRRNIKQVKACYERQLKSSPLLSGKVVVRITIAADGKVKKVEVTSSTVKDEVFEKALLAIIKRWRFPKPAGGGILVVNYPFIFKPAG